MGDDTYISREKLIKEIISPPACGNKIKTIGEAIYNVPIEDVVPIDVHEALKQRAVEKAKDEVAREIFEEIENKLSFYFPATSFVNAPNTMHKSLIAMFAELKKKYCPDSYVPLATESKK